MEQGQLRRFLLLIAPALALSLALIQPALHPDPASAAFGVSSFSAIARNADGTVDYLAGSHPYGYTVAVAMNTDSEGAPEGNPSGLTVDLPAGLLGSAEAVPRCGLADFEGEMPQCRAETQVGVVRANLHGIGTLTAPVFNLAPPLGQAAAFGSAAGGLSVVASVSLRGSGRATHLEVSDLLLQPDLGLTEFSLTLWGVPADHGHDSERVPCLDNGGECPLDTAPKALLTLPRSCRGPLTATLLARSFEDPDQPVRVSSISEDDHGNPQGMVGCDGLSFAPSIAVRPEAAALQPTGLELDLLLSSGESIPGRGAATLDGVKLRLPPGLVLNPAGGAGLAACSAAQIGLRTPAGALPAEFDGEAPACPDASKVGTVTAATPLLATGLGGEVYLATPGENPFGATFAVYLVLENPDRGVRIKLAGRLEPDPESGRLLVELDGLPQFPFEEVAVRLFSGPRAILTAPPACGAYAAGAELIPSSAPEAAAAQVSSSFELSTGPGGGPCPPEASAGALGFEAGSTIPLAAARTPFTARLSRADTAPDLSSVELELPPGLLADLGQVTACSGPPCPPDAAVGAVTIAAGTGLAPLRLSGSLYLSGPYRGAPFSLIAVVPAAVGPFHLGQVTERLAVDLDPRTAALSVRADPLPRILAGIPLELRSLELHLDRPGFLRNPTSCEPTLLTGSATSALGLTEPLSNRFALGGCRALPFKPRLTLRASGALGRNGHPTIAFELRSHPDGAGIARLSADLPAGELLDLRRVRALCPRQVAAAACPAGSRLGHARFRSPLSDGPLAGGVYLRRPAHGLPDLLVDLRSGPVHLTLLGRAAASSGRLVLRFPSLPDVPLSRGEIVLPGGRRGVFVNSAGLCGRDLRGSVVFDGHNGKVRRLRPRLRLAGSC